MQGGGALKDEFKHRNPEAVKCTETCCRKRCTADLRFRDAGTAARQLPKKGDRIAKFFVDPAGLGGLREIIVATAVLMDTLPRSAWAQHYVLFAQALKEEGAPLWGFTARKPRQSRIINTSYVMLGYFG